MKNFKIRPKQPSTKIGFAGLIVTGIAAYFQFQTTGTIDVPSVVAAATSLGLIGVNEAE